MSENENNQYRLLSPWAYVGYGLLFTLPVIGWILAIVFELNDDNLNRRNFARGYWCGVLVAAFILWSGINAVNGAGGGYPVDCRDGDGRVDHGWAQQLSV